MSQTDNNCQKAKSQQIEKMLQKMAVLSLILLIRIKEGGVNYMNSIGDKVGRLEKAK